MNQCEHDHRTGESVALTLPGKEYHLALEGEKWVGCREVGSEYTTAYTPHYWFEGVGVVQHGPNKRIVQFTFETWLAEDGRDYAKDRELEDFILISDRWYTTQSHWGREKKLQMVESRRADLIDHICEEIFTKADSSKKLIPAIYFGMMSYEWLLRNGFVFDETGQANLPNLNLSPV